jgi:hypothetical protein
MSAGRREEKCSRAASRLASGGSVLKQGRERRREKERGGGTQGGKGERWRMGSMGKRERGAIAG